MKVIIVGGVAGGMSAATRLRRLDENAEITVFEGGDYVSFANCGLPYHLSGVIAKREDLILHTPNTLLKRSNLDVRLGWTVRSIDRASHCVQATDPQGQSHSFAYDKLLLSPGSTPVIPPLPGIDNRSVHTLRTINDMDGVLRRLTELENSGKTVRAAVIGAGFIGLEAGEALLQRGVTLSIIEASPHILPPLDRDLVPYIRHAFTSRQAQVFEGVSLRSLSCLDPATGVLSLHLSDGSVVQADIVLLCVGGRACSELARAAGLDLDERGNILVDENQLTSDPDILALGDVTAVRHFGGKHAPLQLAGPANRAGRRAADVIAGRSPVAQAPALGTAVVKVFEQVAAVTGMSRRDLDAAQIDYEVIRIHPLDHAGYYPGAGTLHLLGFFEKSSTKLLGAAGVGPLGGIDKRIDVLSTAIRAGFTAADLAELELCYAPPVGSAKDPVNMLGFAALNVFDALVEQWQPDELPTLLADGAFILDVRPDEARAKGMVPGAFGVPADEIRDRIAQIRTQAAGRRVYVHCTSGVRSYLACRILRAAGLEAYNGAGGWLSLRSYLPSQ